MRSVLLLVFSATPVFAACPTIDDMKSGVRFDLASGEYETLRLVNDTLVESIFHFDGGGALRNLLAHGLYLVEVVDLENDTPVPSTRSVYTYPVEPNFMPMPSVGGSWSTGAALLTSNGIEYETQIYKYGDWAETSFGACTYKSMPITIDYVFEGEFSGDRDIINWLPELGFGYLAGSIEGEDRTDYTYISIQKLAK